MTKETFLSVLRAAITMLGSYIVGHNLFGHAIDASLWQVIGGSLVTVGSILWGIADKSATIEGVQSAVRSVIITIGGLFTAAGMLNGDTLNAILGLVTAVTPVLQSYLSKAKVKAIATGDLKVNTDGKVSNAPPTYK